MLFKVEDRDLVRIFFEVYSCNGDDAYRGILNVSNALSGGDRYISLTSHDSSRRCIVHCFLLDSCHTRNVKGHALSVAFFSRLPVLVKKI